MVLERGDGHGLHVVATTDREGEAVPLERVAVDDEKIGGEARADRARLLVDAEQRSAVVEAVIRAVGDAVSSTPLMPPAENSMPSDVWRTVAEYADSSCARVEPRPMPLIVVGPDALPGRTVQPTRRSPCTFSMVPSRKLTNSMAPAPQSLFVARSTGSPAIPDTTDTAWEAGDPNANSRVEPVAPDTIRIPSPSSATCAAAASRAAESRAADERATVSAAATDAAPVVSDAGVASGPPHATTPAITRLKAPVHVPIRRAFMGRKLSSRPVRTHVSWPPCYTRATVAS